MNKAKVSVVARTVEGKCEILTVVSYRNKRDTECFLTEDVSPDLFEQISHQFAGAALECRRYREHQKKDGAEYG